MRCQAVLALKGFADFVGRSPDKATSEDVRRYRESGGKKDR